MAGIPQYDDIFGYVINALEGKDLSRAELINAVIKYFDLTKAELDDRSIASKYLLLRSDIGTVINEMLAREIISLDENDLYSITEDKIVAIRIDECEKKIIRLICKKPMTKNQLKEMLAESFGTDKTPSKKDDNKLFSYMGQILKELVKGGILDFDGTKYSVAKEKSAYIKNREEVLALKTAFLSTLHSKGGEFFEYYFLNLLKRYLVRIGKTVVDGYVTGGSDDGGIDGIVNTVDALGFKETIMIQTKNRSDTTNERDVRGFYGAVCAKQGTRGIFATVSDFHPMALKFLNSIDNCVGVDGDKIFSMATDTSYGIKRNENKLTIDREII